MISDKLASEKPVFTILVVAIVLVVVVAGAIVTIVKPASLSFHQYVQDVAVLGGALGLGAGVGRGIETYGKAQSPTLVIAADEPPPDDR